ncbi:MAG: type II secretion system F family protein [Ardenticatenaceae bacterium]|nr:type II secretion system F family protein [Ardenticatenaceae bacterium]
MSTSILLLVVAVLAIGIIVYSVILLRKAEGDPLSARIEDFAAREEIVSIEEIEMSMPISERLFLPIVRRISAFIVRLTPEKTLAETTQKLEMAGNPRNMSAAEFWAARVVLAAIFAGLVFMVMTRFAAENRFLYSLGAAALGFYMPAMFLRSIIDRRKDAVLKKLPDALDLMLICVEAGQTFNGAMQRVDEKWDDPLAREFGRAIYEMQLGKTRRQSLRDMADRLSVPDVSSFVAAVIQADQLGVGIGKVLRIQSEQMRIKRRQRAEEKAQQAPVKMLFPMVFLIFPSMFVVLLGPAGFQILRSSALGENF